jgi:hypothetical protein
MRKSKSKAWLWVAAIVVLLAVIFMKFKAQIIALFKNQPTNQTVIPQSVAVNNTGGIAQTDTKIVPSYSGVITTVPLDAGITQLQPIVQTSPTSYTQPMQNTIINEPTPYTGTNPYTKPIQQPYSDAPLMVY